MMFTADSVFNDRIYLTQYKPNIANIADELTTAKVTEEAFFICDVGSLIEKHNEWITYLPRVTPHYAVKCNDTRVVLQVLAGLGAGFDCASKVEMKKVLDLGVSPSRIIFANPAKQNSHIRAAAEYNILKMTFDSEPELVKIKNHHPQAELVIRIRCDAEKAQCQLGMKFGVLPEEAPKLLETARSLNLNVVGVSFHVGSGCMEPAVFNRAIKACKTLFDYGETLGFPGMRFLDIGGGFPGNTGTSIKEIAEVVNASLSEHFPPECGVEIIAEPGRFYVAKAFSLVTLVHSLRQVGRDEDADKKFMYYINDGVYGSFNCVMYDHAVVHPKLLKEYEGPSYQCSIWGPTCDGLDQVCPSEQLPELQLGDWLLFNDMGAYTLVAAGTFNGFPVPRIHYVASFESWEILKEFMSADEFVIEHGPLVMMAGVGCNRDAVGWVGPAAWVAVAAAATSCLGLNAIPQPNVVLDPVFKIPNDIQAQ